MFIYSVHVNLIHPTPWNANQYYLLQATYSVWKLSLKYLKVFTRPKRLFLSWLLNFVFASFVIGR